MSKAKKPRKRARNASDDERRLLAELRRGKAGAKRGSKTWAKLLAKYQPLVDAKLVEVEGGGWAGAFLTLKPTAAAARVEHRVDNPRPSLAGLGTVSEHGRVHELQVELADGTVQSHRWTSKRPLLLWSPRQRAFVFVTGLREPAPKRGDVPRDDGAAATWERFFGKATLQTRELVIPPAELHELGRGKLLAYQTPHKWKGKAAEHTLGRKVRVWSGSAGGRKVFAVAGGNLRMTARGIEG